MLGPDRTVSDSRLELHDLRMTERESGWFKQYFGLPLDVALALLRDLRGDIDLPVRVELERDATDVGLLPVLASTLRQAILGALTSPLKVLGGLADVAGGVLGTALAPLPVEAGVTDLGGAQQQRLEELAGMLAQRPALALSLHGRAGPEDAAGIARRQLIERARADQPLPGEEQLGPGERTRLRDALAQQDPSAPLALDEEIEALAGRLIAQMSVDESQYRSLAEERARQVREALVHDFGVGEDDVVIGEVALGPPSVVIELQPRDEVVGGDARG